ncbi:hypothetical protein PHLGIDRAFT_126492 [Phlebiopsis gigantea 11061_1 CR5-6]|uniref:Uncharacterized protein n=1 Tax=Phlebiopsis gigantea (strain 11061_1 CR5-6) TaxID=745531 RepID=A0A0C3PQ58_PHLG1|nr:hypothetical protein PHLGIDRAFT_126492 [Phlebiopsis gigantea 11061_1 CR5-6]
MSKRFSRVEKGQVSLTSFFTPGYQAKSSKSQKRRLATPRRNATLGESSQQTVRRNENKSPVSSPQTTPKKRSRRLSALGSETNMETIGHVVDGSAEGSERHDETNSRGKVIDLTGSPTSDRIIEYGLPTPVTLLKRRAPPAPEPTPTHARSCQEAVDGTSISKHGDIGFTTPLARITEHAVQQPTPATPSRSRNSHALPQSLFSSPLSRKKSPKHRPVHAYFTSAMQDTTSSESQGIIPSSQTQDCNPFEVQDKASPKPLFKIPQLPARFEGDDTPSRRTSTTDTHSTRFKVPATPVSRRIGTSSKMKETVPTSQPYEEELIFLSPGRSSSTGSSEVVSASQVGEEELILPSLFGTPKRSKKRKLCEILSTPSRRHIQEPLPMSPSRTAQLSPLTVPSSPHDLFPSTPKRKRALGIQRHMSSPGCNVAVAQPRTPIKSPNLDSGIGTSVSPEKLVDESQTQPESPQWEVKTPRSPQPQSSQTQPDSPRWIVKTPTKTQDDSQTQPDSPQWEVKSPIAVRSLTQPESPRRLVKTQKSPQSSQTEPESSQWRVHTPPAQADSSQTEPESSQWVVRTPPGSQTRSRACLPLEDEQDAAAAPSGSLPIAEYESQGPVEALGGSQPPVSGLPPPRIHQVGDESQSQPWDLDTQTRREVLRRLAYVRAQQETAWDNMSDGPPSIPADFGEDADFGDIGTQDLFAQPVKDFLGIR